MNANPLKAYGNWIASVDNQWPGPALESAHRQLIDTVAVMVPGALTPVVRKLSGRARQWGRGGSTVVGTPERLALPWAALVNATSAHALDFDDNFDPPKAHSSAVLWPTILAVAEHEGSAPQDCLDAYIVALQIQGRIGQGLNPPHRDRGWHATGTTGALGAAAACARLLGLSAQQSAMALSLATSTAGGFMSQFGTMAKPLHAGYAAKGGILAACLAQDDMTAGWGTLDGKSGMNTLMVGPDLETLRQGILEPQHGQTLTFETESIGEPLLITEYGFRVKRFPNCGSAHRAMDAALALREGHDIQAVDIERVDIHAPLLHLNNLMYEQPVDGLQAKFSVEYGVACVLIEGKCSLADFTDEAVARRGHRRLVERIFRHPIDRPETEISTLVRISLRDGRVLEQSVFMPMGSKGAEFSNAQYWQKFDHCTAGIMPVSEQQRLKRALEDFTSLSSIGEVTRCMGIELAAEGVHRIAV